MKLCPACGSEYDVTDAICPRCGVELPAPYESISEAEEYDESGEFDTAPETATDSDGVHTIFADGSAMRLAGQQVVDPRTITILSGAEVMLADEIIPSGTVMLAMGRILFVEEGAMTDPQNGATFIDLTGKILAPGLIDVHVHGMMGIDTNQASVEDFRRLSAEAVKHGVTSLVPTTVACSAAELSTVLQNLHDVQERGLPGARLLGAHLESNFISPQYKGAQPPQHIISPNDANAWAIRKLIDDYADEICIITVAPEVPGVMEIIPWLVERKIVVSLGHSAATYEEAMAAIDAGATQVTHLFNAMSPLHHRNPGLIGAALERDEVFTEIVCDGVHVHPSVLTTVFRAKSADRVMCVSDGLQGAGMQEGEFYLGGQHVTVRDGVAWLDSGTIAGSITTMSGIVRLLVEGHGWDLHEALLMTSTTQATSLGFTTLGHIAPQAHADLVVFDQELQVAMTFVGGKMVYQRED